MEQLVYKYKSKPSNGIKFGNLTGVVNSGNLEVLVLKNDEDTSALFEITTSIKGFTSTWQAVVESFCNKYAVAGMKFILHDSGATPPVVMLRLIQAYESSIENMQKNTIIQRLDVSYVELTHRERVLSLVDSGSFKEIYPPECQISSPHLQNLDLVNSADDGVIIGDAMIDNKLITIAATNANFIGGAIGEVNGAKLSEICLRAIKNKAQAVVLLLDSGGVRLQEANAGEIAIGELIESVLAVRFAQIPVIVVVAGKNGAFGGIGITSAVADYLFISFVHDINYSTLTLPVI